MLGILAGFGVAATLWPWILRRAIHRMRLAERRARASERLADLGAMTGGLAHEIKNPLSTIGLNAQYACTKQRADCPSGPALPLDAASCTVALNFVARRIDAQQFTAYNNNP